MTILLVLQLFNAGFITSPAEAVAKYCDEHVCMSDLSVCLRGYLPNHTRDLYQMFFARCLWPWLGPRKRVSYGGFLSH